MGPEVIYNSSPLWAEDHISVEAARSARGKVTNPGDRLAAVLVHVSVVSDGERHGLSVLRKHDLPPASDIQKRHGIQRPMPNRLHRSRADAGEIVPAREAEPFLNSRMEPPEFLSQSLFVDGSHLIPTSASGSFRRQFLALGRSAAVTRPHTAKTARARLKVTGLKAALK